MIPIKIDTDEDKLLLFFFVIILKVRLDFIDFINFQFKRIPTFCKEDKYFKKNLQLFKSK